MKTLVGLALVMVASWAVLNTAVAESASPALGDNAVPKAALLAEIAGNMRELLSLVTPEIALPKIDLVLPSLATQP